MEEFIKGLVETAEQEAGKSVLQFTKDDYINHYFSQSGIFRSSFDLRKSGLIEYLDEIDAYQAIKIVRYIFFGNLTHAQILRLEFFASYNSMLDDLEKRIKTLGRVEDENIYNAQFAALTFAWIGIESLDAVNVRRDAIDETLKTVELNGVVYDLPPRSIPYISRYKNQQRLVKMSGSGLCEVFLRESPYLFRTFRSNQMSQRVMLSKITTGLNVVEGKRFVYNSVKMSGAFFRVMEYERRYGRIRGLPPGLPEKERQKYIKSMEQVFKLPMSSETMLAQRIAQYEAYKDVYHSAE